MKNKHCKIHLSALILGCSLFLSPLLAGCGTENASAEGTSGAGKNNSSDPADLAAADAEDGYVDLEADTDGNLTIYKSSISDTATFYNYKTGDVTVQLLALTDTAGEIHLAFNTCQSCSPSPRAYYRQEGDQLICQNCGFAFSAEEVGKVAGGCNPAPLEEMDVQEDRIVIPASLLDSSSSAFAKWEGPTAAE